MTTHQPIKDIAITLESDKTTNTRWWDYYVVRYLVGTVVGAAIVVFLNGYTLSPFANFFDLASEDTGEFGKLFANITLYSSVGFAFCYIASAPILTLHATRTYLQVSQLKKHRFTWLMGAIAIVVSTIVVVCTSLCLNKTMLQYVQYWPIIFYIVVGIQVLLLTVMFWDRCREIKSFYRGLAHARTGANAFNTTKISEYVESYRHLREHGNAFLIILFEFVLAYVLLNSSGEPIEVMLIVAVWIFPAGICWLIGTILEWRLVKKRI